MPHKRAKQSVRLADRQKRGSDLPPTRKDKESRSELGGMSKSMYRILNAEKIRNERKAKTAKTADRLEPESKKVQAKQSLHPHPNESLRSFNQRVEEEYRPEMTAAYKTSRRNEGRLNKKRKRQEANEEEDAAAARTNEKISASHSPDATRNRPEEWAKAPQRTRLNDVALAPPTLGRPARQEEAVLGSHRLPITLAQQAAIELERKRAIERYRQIRDARQDKLQSGTQHASGT